MVNHKTDVWRATRHEVAVDLTSTGHERGSELQPNDGAVTLSDDRDDLVRRLSRLPEQQRKTVVMRYYADFRSSTPSKSSITAITWTNADGSQGRIAVTQKQG